MNNTKQIVFEVAVAFVPLPSRPCDAVSANERGSNVVTTASNLVVSQRQPSDVSVRSFLLEFAKPRCSITSPLPSEMLSNAILDFPSLDGSVSLPTRRAQPCKCGSSCHFDDVVGPIALRGIARKRCGVRGGGGSPGWQPRVALALLLIWLLKVPLL